MTKFLGNGDNGTRAPHEWKHVDAKAHLVSPQHPSDQCRSETVEGHECAIDGPLAAHDTGVPECMLAIALRSEQDGLQNKKAWYALEGDKRGSG